MLLPDQVFPPDYFMLQARRLQTLQDLYGSLHSIRSALHHYRHHPEDFICDWVDTFDPRNAGKPGMTVRMPFVLFERQREMVLFLKACLDGEANGLVEKSRDIGATWVCCAFAVWLWLFWEGSAIGFGSRKQDLVDRIGDMDSIFEKIRAIIRGLPQLFLPIGFNPDEHMHFMKIVNPENGSSITGESGDDIGRGGRKRIYIKDESAHYEHPELIEAALLENTRVQIDISSVNGIGNVFYRKREAGQVWEPGDKITKDRTNVFIFDWRDHPLKTHAWYQQARQKAIDEGLLHIFAQEVDRNYAASQEGVLIPGEWVKAAIDAHIALGFDDSGEWMAGLDVADEGMDRNALVARKGVVIKLAKEWGERDTGLTARRCIENLEDKRPVTIEYDVVGVGAGIKSEINRLNDDKLMPANMTFVAWNAAASPLDPDKRIIPGDRTSPINKDFFENLKGQAGMKLRIRFEKTFRARTEGLRIPISDLISIDSQSVGPGMLRQLERELSQPQMTKSRRLKFMIDKTPDGTRSPNLFDACNMCFWPVKRGYDSSMSWVV